MSIPVWGRLTSNWGAPTFFLAGNRFTNSFEFVKSSGCLMVEETHDTGNKTLDLWFYIHYPVTWWNSARNQILPRERWWREDHGPDIMHLGNFIMCLNSFESFVLFKEPMTKDFFYSALDFISQVTTSPVPRPRANAFDDRAHYGGSPWHRVYPGLRYFQSCQVEI